VLLPALIAKPLHKLAEQVAQAQGCPDRASRYERNLGALAGRLLAPGGWRAGTRRASAEVLWTERHRPYDESTLRRAARELSAAGAVPYAERLLEHQVHRAVGTRSVAAYTDLYDQVLWTKKSAWVGPVGSLGNRLLPATYFGLTLVRPEQGPGLAYHVSWHKPASPLFDALQALHLSPWRHAWLMRHVAVHVMDRGTQGDPVLRWALLQGIPYLTLSNGTVHWQRYQHPTHQTSAGVPIFVRSDRRLKDTPVLSAVRVTAPRTIVFPARPDQGADCGRAIRYRTAADLSKVQIETLDQVYKSRWPNNEHPIKSLVAVGFDRNLDRTLDLTTSRGHDGDVARKQAQINTLDTQIDALGKRPFGEAWCEYKRSVVQRGKKAKELLQLEQAPVLKGARSDRGGEHLCKLLALLLFNALALLLWRSPLDAVRVMTPARVRELLLGCSALGCMTQGAVTLWIEGMAEPTDRAHQEELVRLLNATRLDVRGARLTLRIRDPSAKSMELRIAV